MAPTLIHGTNYKYWVFVALSIGTFAQVVTHGSTVVALPTIADHFGIDIPTAQWIVLGESLTIAALLLPMGRLSDIVGRKRLYLVGFGIFVTAAVLAGTSTNVVVLILAKVLQGSGAAITQGTSLAIIASVFPSSERGKGLGMNMSVVGAGGVTGLALGSLLVSSLGWRWVFLFNIPSGILGFMAAFIVLDNQPLGQKVQGNKFDWLGAGLSIGILLILLLALTSGYRLGWTSAPIVLALLSVGIILGGFIWWELRVSLPMLELDLFKRRLFSLGVLAAFVAFLASNSMRFLMPFYLQGVLGYSVGKIGIIMVPTALVTAIVGPVSGRLSDRYGWKALNVGGLAVSATGMFILSRITETTSLGLVMGAMMLQSGGMFTFVSPNTSSILSTVERWRYGVVASLTNLTRNTAQVSSIALATAIVTATMTSMGQEPSLAAVHDTNDPAVLHAFTAGLRSAFLVMGGLLLGGMVISLIKGRQTSAAS
jgi:EmrB/QacA subfamily drug resistance transporter